MKFIQVSTILILIVTIIGVTGCSSTQCSPQSVLKSQCRIPTECCNGNCLENCKDSFKDAIYEYSLKGVKGSIKTRLYQTVKDYSWCIGEREGVEMSYSCGNSDLISLNQRDTILLKLNDEYQKKYLNDLLSEIKLKTK